MKREEHIIDQIVRLAQKEFPDSEIFLYGSRARHDSKSDSDWDLLVLLDTQDVSFNMERKIIDDFYDLELNIGEAFSPLIYSKSDWEEKYVHTPLFENISKEGIRIK